MNILKYKSRQCHLIIVFVVIIVTNYVYSLLLYKQTKILEIKKKYFQAIPKTFIIYSGQTEKRYKDGSSEIKLPNGSIRYFDPKNTHVREEWRFPDGAILTVSANGEQRIVFPNGQIEVHTKDHKVMGELFCIYIIHTLQSFG